MTNQKVVKWTTKVIRDSESHELMIELPLDLLERVCWKIGDIVRWELNEEGDAILTKVNSSDENASRK